MICLPKGEVVVSYFDPVTGRCFDERPPVHNDFMYEGADILGKLVAGRTEFVPNMAYIEFINDVSIPSISVSREDGRSYYAGLETSGPPLYQDYLRVPLLFSPQMSAENENYISNVVKWSIISTGTVGVSGVDFSAAEGSQVYGFALVAAPDVNDRSKDLVFARVYPETAIPKLATSQIQARWSYKFT